MEPGGGDGEPPGAGLGCGALHRAGWQLGTWRRAGRAPAVRLPGHHVQREVGRAVRVGGVGQAAIAPAPFAGPVVGAVAPGRALDGAEALLEEQAAQTEEAAQLVLATELAAQGALVESV